MNKFVEAIRRLLLIITWLPTTVFVCYALLNFESVTSSMDEAIPILAGLKMCLVLCFIKNLLAIATNEASAATQRFPVFNRRHNPKAVINPLLTEEYRLLVRKLNNSCVTVATPIITK